MSIKSKDELVDIFDKFISISESKSTTIWIKKSISSTEKPITIIKPNTNANPSINTDDNKKRVIENTIIYSSPL